jgi:hypothetical protein
MTHQASRSRVARAPDTLAGRIVGVIVYPRRTFGAIAADPRWAGMLLVITVAAVLLMAVVLTTEVGQQAMLDQQVSTMESFGMTVSDERYAAMEAAMPHAASRTALTIAVALPSVLMALAGLLFGVFKFLGGPAASFRQVLAVVVFSSTILLVQQLIAAPLNYARESLSSPTNLTVFLPYLEEGTFLARALGLIDLFHLWWLAVLSIGLSVLYARPTAAIAGGLLAAYALIATGVAAMMGAFGGS